MKENIQDSLIKLLSFSLKSSGIAEIPPEELSLDFSLSNGFGDLSCNTALKLSRKKKQPPISIAKEIAASVKSSLENSELKEYLQDVKAEGAGFVNFYLTDGFFHSELMDIASKKEGFARVDFGKGKKVLIEFVSANPTGPLSVAHARQAVVGDALASILSYLGFEVSREYYLNDEGNQINILGESIRLRMREARGEKVDFPENYYQGDYIRDIARDMDARGVKADDFGEYGAGIILKDIEGELEAFGVKFDSWYSQKSLRQSGKIDSAFRVLKDNGFLYEQDGALWFASTRFHDDKDRVVIKSDGSYTYLAPDIAYHQDKYKRGFELLINLWGPDHHGYISRLKASVEAFGADPQSLSVIIVQLASIFREGKPVEMSTRKGQYITLKEVLDEVGKDAARFFFLMRRTSSHLNFDLEVAKKQTPENPVYYIQYAHARICSILRQSGKDPGSQDADPSLLKEKEELALIKKLWQLPFMLNICLSTQDPYMLTVYLQEAAESFHRFYDKHRVLGEDKELEKARLLLIYCVKTTISLGLGLLGVSRPEKM